MESSFGERLRFIRKERGYVQKQLGELTGVGQVAIANYEKGKRFPGEETLRKLTEVLQVSLDYLLAVDSANDVPEVSGGDFEGQAFSVEGLIDLLLDESVERSNAYVEEWAARAEYGLEQIYSLILVPVLKETGGRWVLGDITVAEEHLISARVREIITIQGDAAIRRSGRTLGNGKVWLGFCVPGEEHDLVILMVSRLLRLDGWNAVYLGLNLPLPDLLSAIERYKPHAMAFSATIAKNTSGMDAYLERILQNLPPGCRICAGGSGLESSDLEPLGILYAETLADTVRLAEGEAE